MPQSLVIIPTFNEKENIFAIVDAVLSLPQHFDLLVVDDNSPDGTAGMVMDLQLKYPKRLHLAQRKGKLGLGTAYIHGFRWALERQYDYVFEMDADFSHDPKDLERLLGGLRHVPCGHSNWLALQRRRQCGELAYVTGLAELLCIQVRSPGHGAPHSTTPQQALFATRGRC